MYSMWEGRMSYLKWLLIPALIAVLFGCSTTKIDWEMASGINTAKAYQEFLAKHPDSEYTQKAQVKLEPMIYQKALDEGTATVYSSYLMKLPQGEHTKEIRAKLQEVRCQDPNIGKTFPEWLKKGKPNDPERRASWLLDNSFIGAAPSNIGRGFRACGDDPESPLELGWGAGHLIYYDGRGVIVGPDGKQVLVGYTCK
jgi:hypothetical protein